MDRTDILLAAVAGYVAVATLVRLMAHRRNELVVQIRDKIAAERAKRDAEAAAADEAA